VLALAILEASLRELSAGLPRSRLALVYLPSVLASYELVGDAGVARPPEISRGLPSDLPSASRLRAGPVREIWSAAELSRRSDRLLAGVAAICARNGIELVDARAALRRASAQRPVHGPRDWSHPNRRGYEALAAAIAASARDARLSGERRMASAPSARTLRASLEEGSAMLPNPLHPAVVHLPIALAVVIPLLALLAAAAIQIGFLPQRSWLGLVLLQALLVGSAFAALETGEDQEERVERVVAERHIEAHEEAAERFLWLAGLGLAVVAAGLVPGRAGAVGRIAATAASLGVLAAGVAVGHSGGELVYVHGAASAYVDPGVAAPEQAVRRDRDADE
jgi:hypothetical protein